ncbi:hypothetical protein LguiB_026265 [Lonicera macranthoides]
MRVKFLNGIIAKNDNNDMWQKKIKPNHKEILEKRFTFFKRVHRENLTCHRAMYRTSRDAQSSSRAMYRTSRDAQSSPHDGLLESKSHSLDISHPMSNEKIRNGLNALLIRYITNFSNGFNPLQILNNR